MCLNCLFFPSGAHPYPNLRGYRPSTQSRSLASTIASGRPVVRLTPRAMANLLPTPPIDWKWMFKVCLNTFRMCLEVGQLTSFSLSRSRPTGRADDPASTHCSPPRQRLHRHRRLIRRARHLLFRSPVPLPIASPPNQQPLSRSPLHLSSAPRASQRRGAFQRSRRSWPKIRRQPQKAAATGSSAFTLLVSKMSVNGAGFGARSALSILPSTALAGRRLTRTPNRPTRRGSDSTYPSPREPSPSSSYPPPPLQPPLRRVPPTSPWSRRTSPPPRRSRPSISRSSARFTQVSSSPAPPLSSFPSTPSWTGPLPAPGLD